jgi:hypothetical protein
MRRVMDLVGTYGEVHALVNHGLWRPYGSCYCIGRWRYPLATGTIQVLCVPNRLGEGPEALGFGLGWWRWLPCADPRFCIFYRCLDETGAIDLARYPTLSEDELLLWPGYRYVELELDQDLHKEGPPEFRRANE